MDDRAGDRLADEPADEELFRVYAATRGRDVRNELVERHLGLAIHVARRFAGGGRGDDDLRQVAMLGLVKAVDRFDPAHGTPFAAFAVRTIDGELKRYLRDKTWAVRVPRSAKELHLAVRRASDELLQRNGAAPRVDDIAAELRLHRDDVLRGLAATAAYSPSTLDGRSGDEDTPADRSAVLAEQETGFSRVEDVDVVDDLLRRLPDREREIVTLRVYGQLSQSEIADRVGVSQMHVSRLLSRSFEQMRSWLERDGVVP
jgi:RNA polymerase sigma-B factor